MFVCAMRFPPLAVTLLLLSLSRGDAAIVETFGAGPNQFSIEFQQIGNAGNGDDAGAGGGQVFSAYGGVPYSYRMGVTEVPLDWITKASAQGLSGVTAGGATANSPANNVTWFEAAAFVNWLNTSTGKQAAYNMTFSGGFWSLTAWSSADAWQAGGENRFRHKDAYYFLPSEDEWYKAAYHKNDGVTANYWDYATGQNMNSIPTTVKPTAVASGSGLNQVVYENAGIGPADVGLAGGLSAYGIRGQNGNLQEWMETEWDGVNDGNSLDRVTRGGNFTDDESFLRSSYRNNSVGPVSDPKIGFRVAAIPEPSSGLLLAAGFVSFGVFMRNRGRAGRQRG